MIRIHSPAGSGFAGVTTRSSSALEKVAFSPLTSTDLTSLCVKSRLTRSSAVVVQALIVVTAWRGLLLVPG